MEEVGRQLEGTVVVGFTIHYGFVRAIIMSFLVSFFKPVKTRAITRKDNSKCVLRCQ